MSWSPAARRSIRALVPLTLLFVAVAASRSHTGPGITFKIRTQLKNHQVPDSAKPDSVRIKRQAAIAAARVDDITVGDPGGGGGPGRGAANQGRNDVLMMSGTFTKDYGRMDVQGVIGGPELTATQSAIFTDTSSAVMDDLTKTYWFQVFDIGSILAFTRAVDNPTTQIGMLKVSWDSLPTETYDGRAAKHYQLKMAYGFVQRGREDSSKLLSITRVTSNYWVADLPVNFENRFAGIGRPRRQVPDSLRGEWDKMLALYSQLGKGTIVKFSAAGFIGINGNGTTEYTRTMEMTNIVATDVDESKVKIPSDYTKTNPPGRGRGGI